MHTQREPGARLRAGAKPLPHRASAAELPSCFPFSVELAAPYTTHIPLGPRAAVAARAILRTGCEPVTWKVQSNAGRRGGGGRDAFSRACPGRANVRLARRTFARTTSARRTEGNLLPSYRPPRSRSLPPDAALIARNCRGIKRATVQAAGAPLCMPQRIAGARTPATGVWPASRRVPSRRYRARSPCGWSATATRCASG